MISENPCCIESEQRNLKLQFPSQGWKQILTARKEMLDAYDNARVQARAHEVETYHGNVAEAICRKWLSKFLPKKYGVTSGYIVSPGQKDTDKVPHYDVIIYDQLESPILWVEGNPDNSSQGRSMAIPVEYVLAVFEVKSSFSTKTIKASIEHLGNSIEIEKKHIGTLLSWSELEFSKFAFDIIALIQGKFKSGYLSSWFCVGSSWHETDQK